MKLARILVVIALLTCFLLQGYLRESCAVDYEKVADKITAEIAKKLKKDKSLQLIGTGGAMMHDIQMMMMAFDFYQITDVETARELLVYSVEEYLSAINSSEEIRPYLHNYPFTAENIEIDIYFRKPDRYNVPFGEISVASARRGKLIYFTESSNMSPLHRKYEETYQDALKIVSSSPEAKN